MFVGKFFHIYIIPATGVTHDQIQAKINLSNDWMKYDDRNWIVYSTNDISSWQIRLSDLVKPNGRLLILEMKPGMKQGWMLPQVWTWLNKNRI